MSDAERRIAEAAKTRATSLDLYDMQLTELPASAGNLTSLTTLDLEHNRLTPELEAAHREGIGPNRRK